MVEALCGNQIFCGVLLNHRVVLLRIFRPLDVHRPALVDFHTSCSATCGRTPRCTSLAWGAEARRPELLARRTKCKNKKTCRSGKAAHKLRRLRRPTGPHRAAMR